MPGLSCLLYPVAVNKYDFHHLIRDEPPPIAAVAMEPKVRYNPPSGSLTGGPPQADCFNLDSQPQVFAYA